MSATPFGNSRTSSGAPSRLCATTCLLAVSCMPFLPSLAGRTRVSLPTSRSGVKSIGNGLLAPPMEENARVAGTKTRSEGDTATRILDAAERLVQIRGFSGFSYADVAEELGVTKASLHYHFAGKAEL